MSYARNPHDGTHIHYTVEGLGPPLVLFHGTGGSADFWSELGYVNALKTAFQLILMDARGHGHSDKPRTEDAYAMELVVTDIVAVLDHLGVAQAHYLGYSWGGRVAYGIGAYAAQRFRSLIVGGGTWKTTPGWFDRLTFPGAQETIDTRGMAAFLDAWERHLGRTLPAQLRAMYLANDSSALAACLCRSDREGDFRGALARMTMPVLILVGSEDHERVEQSRVAAALLTNAELSIIPGADHVGAILDPDVILSRITVFLQRNGRHPVQTSGSTGRDSRGTPAVDGLLTARGYGSNRDTGSTGAVRPGAPHITLDGSS